MKTPDNKFQENLSTCPICKKSFEEGDEVFTIQTRENQFVMLHKKCQDKISDAGFKTIKVSPPPRLKSTDQLWRYMELPKFISMLKNGAIYFPSPKGFSDIYEGAYCSQHNKDDWDNFHLSFLRIAIITAPDNRWHNIKPDDVEENAQQLLRRLSKHNDDKIFISCWHNCDFESEAMWKMYSVNNKYAIAIQCNFESLSRELRRKAQIRPVTYIDYTKHFVGTNESYWFKRKAFEYEKEVRAIIYDFKNKGKTGIEIKVNLESLIQNVYISPYAPDWFSEVVSDLISRYGYKLNVHPSSMALPLL